MKNAAYDCLNMKCKELFLNANKDFVIKKISSLGSSFRHQLRRINKMKKMELELMTGMYRNVHYGISIS